MQSIIRRTSARFTKRSTAPPALEKAIRAKIDHERHRVKGLLKEHGNAKLGEVTLEQVYQGSRGITTMAYEPSLLNAQTGITFRGLSIPECKKVLPRAFNGKGTEPLPEGILWLLLTGSVPSAEEAKALSANLRARATEAKLAAVFKVLDAVPQPPKPAGSTDGFTHPMNQLILATTTLASQSRFAHAYQTGVKKLHYWEPILEDSLDLIAALPAIAGKIFRNSYHGAAVRGETPATFEWKDGQDWTEALVSAMDIGGAVTAANATVEQLVECLRLYLTIHVDHEGGNVSAHTTVLVGSALSDPYLSYAAGMAGLAGPLHGLANQEVLSFLKGMITDLEGQGINIATIPYDDLKAKSVEYAWKVLNSGKVIPGFGHAVLRETDPRYMVQREFAQQKLPDFPLFRVVSACFETFPVVLTEHGKTKNPYPNVDAHSGCLLQRYGLVQEDYYTVLFGVSRALGVLSALTWNRALGIPIERPKSVTTDQMCAKFNYTYKPAQ